MAFFSFLHENSTILNVFAHNKVRYGPMRDLRRNLMAGPSPLSMADRELIAAFVSAVNRCGFCAVEHAIFATELGADASILEALVTSVDSAPIPDKLKPIFRFVKKLTEEPAKVVQADVDAVFAAGWNETALGDAIAVCAFFNMVNRIADGHGIKSLQPVSQANA